MVTVVWNNYAGTAYGRGGDGGTGGDGANGCVIVYYSRPKAVEDGPIVTSEAKVLLDEYGRRLVV